MNKKALLIAVSLAVTGMVLLGLHLERFEREVAGGPKVPVVVAVRDIRLGEPIAESMLARREVPEAYVEDRHIRAADVTRLLGVRASLAIRANEAILWTDLATTASDRRDLSGLVQPGMRAITIPTDVSSSFGGLVRPGDRVDVLFTTVKRGEGVLGDEVATLTLLQNLLVLAAGQDMGAVGTATQANPAFASVNQVTLSVTAEQAQTLTFAAKNGTLTLVLRNPDDIALLEGLPDTRRFDLTEQEQRARLLRRTPSATHKEIERVR